MTINETTPKTCDCEKTGAMSFDLTVDFSLRGARVELTCAACRLPLDAEGMAAFDIPVFTAGAAPLPVTVTWKSREREPHDWDDAITSWGEITPRTEA